MAFDAGMLACVISEIRRIARGARIERVFQPERDEIVLQMRSFEGGRRLLINAGSASPRIGFTDTQKENPMTPPMLCMLLRKHLQGAKLSEIAQEGFERVVRITFETRDEMGFACKRHLIAEVMGKYSNLMFTDGDDKILSVLHPVDFTTSGLRQVLPGMRYELPPKQEKENPLSETREGFLARLASANPESSCDRYASSAYLGISATVSREIAYRANRESDRTLGATDPTALADAFFEIVDAIREERFAPCMVLEGDRPVEYAFCQLTHYGNNMTVKPFESAGALLDAFFGGRDREQHIRQRAADVLRILTAADTRIRRKLELQRGELADCEKGIEYKKMADLITGNLHLLQRGMRRVELTDYEDYREDGTFGTCVIELDTRLSPAANAQRFYKRYAKSKTARVELTRQIELGEAELKYIDSVFDALTHAETAADLAEIRDELYRSGYASRMKNYAASKKSSAPVVAEFRTSGGYRVLCGKNNLQNEYITHKLADKNDYWFHVKNLPGSHTVLITNGEEPSERDFTEAAEIAACFSKGADGQNVEVDYTLVRHVKKPAGGKPGLVIYHTNWSCIVTPNAQRIAAMRVQK
ncbi:MAG: fibronectin/fibrinogen-binding protein [Ruminococcaceae bacterium]|nr:fibronectin/fibrinogen-binding protein [Oscillospiraceae bacterium]